MPYAVITSVLIPGNCDVALLGRARNRAGSLLTAATVSAIAWTLTDATTEEAVATGTFTPATVIMDALTVDALWLAALQGKDTTGYIFRGIIPAASIPVANSGHRLQADVKFTLTSGEILRGVFSWPTAKVFG